MTNAVKYSPEQHDIEVTTECRDSHFICCVKDKGIGIPKENQDKIFERYFRVSGHHRLTWPGLGLGLFISSEIIRRQNGKIWVESDENKGSTFCFSLPKQNQKTATNGV